MKIQVNDIVIPKSVVARVVSVTKEKVTFERTDSKGEVKIFVWTRQHAETRGISLPQLLEENVFVIDPSSLKKLT